MSEHLFKLKGRSMSDIARANAETLFARNGRDEREINDALKLEEERHEAVIKNMQRLRELRLSQNKARAHM
jgi:hypothetical protein